MAGHHPDAAGRGQDVSEVPLVDAARLLGATPEALRKRLQRGKSLRGIKRDGEWYVRLPAAVVARQDAAGRRPDAVSGHGRDAAGPAAGRILDTAAPGDAGGRTRQDDAMDATAGPGATGHPELTPDLVAALRDQIASQAETIVEQRVELEARRREVQELHVLLQRAQQLALPAPEPRRHEPVETPQETLAGEKTRLWWARLMWWR
jgi:hypothetical protein